MNLCLWNVKITRLLVLSEQLLIFIRLLLFLKSIHWLKINERIKFSQSHINLEKLFNLLTSALFFHSLHFVVLGLLLLLPLAVILSPLVLKLQIDLFIIVLQLCGTVSHSDLRHVAHHVTPLPTLNSPVSDLSTYLFLKKLNAHRFHLTCSFPP